MEVKLREETLVFGGERRDGREETTEEGIGAGGGGVDVLLETVCEGVEFGDAGDVVELLVFTSDVHKDKHV